MLDIVRDGVTKPPPPACRNRTPGQVFALLAYVIADDDQVVRLWLTPSQAAVLIGITARTLYEYEKHGLLHPGRTPGGHRRYSADEVDALIRRTDAD